MVTALVKTVPAGGGIPRAHPHLVSAALVDLGGAFPGERDDVVVVLVRPSIPGDPIGIPGTATPATGGRSRSSRRITSAGTCPSTTYPPMRAV